MAQKPIKIQLQLQGGADSIIPLGITETLTIEIIDERALYHFKESSITRRFALTQQKDGVESKYIERLQKTACMYPGMARNDIVNHIKDRLKVLGAKHGK